MVSTMGQNDMGIKTEDRTPHGSFVLLPRKRWISGVRGRSLLSG